MDTKGVSGVVGTDGGRIATGRPGAVAWPGSALTSVASAAIPSGWGQSSHSRGKGAGSVPRGLRVACSYPGLGSSVPPEPPGSLPLCSGALGGVRPQGPAASSASSPTWWSAENQTGMMPLSKQLAWKLQETRAPVTRAETASLSRAHGVTTHREPGRTSSDVSAPDASLRSLSPQQWAASPSVHFARTPEQLQLLDVLLPRVAPSSRQHDCGDRTFWKPRASKMHQKPCNSVKDGIMRVAL